jgi:hypothetical protein
VNLKYSRGDLTENKTNTAIYSKSKISGDFLNYEFHAASN